MITLQATLKRVKSGIFQKYSRRPFGRGYLSYRQLRLPEYVSTPVPEGKLPDGWGLWLDERAVEYPWFFSRLPSAAGRLLDAGSVLNYGFVLAHPKLQNKNISILTLAPESECHWQRGISYVYGDIRDCCFRDNYFDSVACISTLEHVGMDNTRHYTTDRSKNERDPASQLQALLELRRVLKTGGVLFLSLPFGSAHDYGWLQVADTDRVNTLVNAFQPNNSRVEYFRYKPSGWQRSTAVECRDARYFDPSQRKDSATDLAAAEAIVCLELTK